jgi:hypothetical protein
VGEVDLILFYTRCDLQSLSKDIDGLSIFKSAAVPSAHLPLPRLMNTMLYVVRNACQWSINAEPEKVVSISQGFVKNKRAYLPTS